MNAAFTSRQTMQSLQYKTASQTLWSKQYTWVPNAKNLLQIADTITPAQTYNYSYDTVNRLTAASGGSQTVTSQPTAGAGTVSVTGAERSAVYTPSGCTTNSCSSIIFDSGTVTLTVNGIAETVSYGQGSTLSAKAPCKSNKIIKLLNQRAFALSDSRQNLCRLCTFCTVFVL